MIDPMNWNEWSDAAKVIGTLIGTGFSAIIAGLLGARNRHKQEIQYVSQEQNRIEPEKSDRTFMDNLTAQIRELCGVTRENTGAVRELTEVIRHGAMHTIANNNKIDELTESNRAITRQVHIASEEIVSFTRAVRDLLDSLKKIPDEISIISQFFRQTFDHLGNLRGRKDG